jgi:hypothetical protein
MPIDEHKAQCSPKFARVGIAVVFIAALAIASIVYAKRQDAEESPHLLIRTFDGGAARRSIPYLLDQDSLDLRSIAVSISDPLVVQAEKAIRAAFNLERNRSCTSKNLSYVQGEILYARKAMALNGTVLYTLEVQFDDEAVFARVALLPNTVDAQFQLIFSIPGPCEGELQDQLAVSALGR